MALLSLETVKGHLRIEHNDEDAQIAIYQAAAESIIVEYLDRIVVAVGVTLPGIEDEGYDATAMVITPAITAAILLMIGELFETREAGKTDAGDAVMPRPVRALLAPWRVWRLAPQEECA